MKRTCVVSRIFAFLIIDTPQYGFCYIIFFENIIRIISYFPLSFEPVGLTFVQSKLTFVQSKERIEIPEDTLSDIFCEMD